MKKLTTLLALALALTGCASSSTGVGSEHTPERVSDHATTSMKKKASQGLSVDDVSDRQVWGGADNVTQLKHLYFSEQPDGAALDVAKANGVVAVIDLRFAEEADRDEKSAVEERGLAYYNVPIRKNSDTLDAGALERIESIVKSQGKNKVLLHCSTGNRAAAWLATHLANVHHMEQGEAMAMAKKAGLTSEKVEERVRNFLQSQ